MRLLLKVLLALLAAPIIGLRTSRNKLHPKQCS